MAHKTDGSVLGDLADESSPRHAAAVRMFQKACDALPDLDALPSDGTFFNGDVCKVHGQMYVYSGTSWVARMGEV